MSPTAALARVRLNRFKAEQRRKEIRADRDAPMQLRPGVVPRPSEPGNWRVTVTWLAVAFYVFLFWFVAWQVYRAVRGH